VNLASYQVIGVDVDFGASDQAPVIPPFCDIAPFKWYDIPFPNLTVQSNPPNFQAFWFLDWSLPFQASSWSLRFFHDVRLKLIHALSGDPSCNVRGSMRNAVCLEAPARCFTKERRTLYEVNPRHITLPARTLQNNAHKYEVGNRNRVTFNVVLRRFKELREKASVSELFNYARRFQDQCNAEPLPDPENWQIASSVKRNGPRYRIRADYNYGAMQLPDAPWDEMSEAERVEEIRRRQSMGAHWMHDRRKTKTRAKLEVAVQELQREGQKVTQRAVAARSGCAIQTVNSHWPSLF
jgi:hypothetical protein